MTLKQVKKALEEVQIKMLTSIGDDKKQWIRNYNELVRAYNLFPENRYKLNEIPDLEKEQMIQTWENRKYFSNE